jgi:hypothetical protein
LAVINELVVVIFVLDAFEINPATWVSVCSIKDALSNGINGLLKVTKSFLDPPKYFLGS